MSELLSNLKRLLGRKRAEDQLLEERILRVGSVSQRMRAPESAPKPPDPALAAGTAAPLPAPKAAPPAPPAAEMTAWQVIEKQAQKSRLRPWRTGEVIVNTYRVEEVKKGGMGYVYIAEHQGWKTKVAIKAPNERMLSRPSFFVRVLREADAWIGLGLHPHIAYCYFVRQIEEVPYIFIEYVDGGSLKEWISKRRCYDLRVGLDLAIQFCHGMEFAHNRGMVHRDIKPENILLTEDGTVKITDFGIARMGLLDEDKDEMEPDEPPDKPGPGPLTRFGTVMGSVDYMSPEQWENPHGVDKRADIYSFGVCLYEMLCGRKPFDIASMKAQRQQAKPFDPLVLREDLPASLVTLLKKGVGLDREHRFESFAEMRDELVEIYMDLFREEPPHGGVEEITLKADGLNNRAVSYIELGKEEEAVALFDEALKVDPQHLEATFNLGYLKWHRAEVPDDVFVTQMRELENSHSADPNYWRCLSWLQFERGEAEDVERIQKLGYEDPRMQRALADKDRPLGRFRRALTGHDNDVTVVRFSPDGRYVLSAGADRTIRMWELLTGKEVRRIEGHAERVTSVGFSADGRYIVSGSADQSIRLWDLSEGKDVQRLGRITMYQGHTDRITSVCFSPGGQFILSGSEDKTVRLWEVSTGAQAQRFDGHTEIVTSVCFSPDGQTAASGSWDQTVRIWDIANRKEIWRLEGHEWVVSSVCFSPDGRYVVSGSWDQSLRMWDVALGREVRRFDGHSNRVTCVSVSPDGRLILSGGLDQVLRVWDVASRREVRSFEGHTEDVTSVAFSPDGRFAVSGSEDDTVRLWEVHYPGKSWERVHPYPMLCKAKAVASMGQETNQARKLLTAAKICFVKGSLREAYGLLREGQSVAGYERDREILDLVSQVGAKGKRTGLRGAWPLHAIKGHTDWVIAVGFSPDGRLAASGSDDQTVRLWDVASGAEARRFDGHTMSVASVCFSPDGKYLLSGSWDQTVRLWEILSGAQVLQLEHEGGITSVCFSPDGRQALSGGYDQTVRLWDIAGGQEVKRFEGHTDRVTSVALSPDGRQVLSGSVDQTVRLWDVASGAELRQFEGHGFSVTSVHFSPQGQYLLSGSWDQTVRLWQAAVGMELRKFQGHTSSVTSACFSPDGHYVLSGSDDRTIRLWEVGEGMELRRFEGHLKGVTAVSFSPDGRYVVSGSEDQMVRLWEIDWEWELPE